MEGSGLVIKSCTPAEYAKVLLQLENKLEQTVSFLQSAEYGQMQQRAGKKVLYFSGSLDGRQAIAGVAIRYQIPGKVSYYYCPYGPVVLDWDQTTLAAVRNFLYDEARKAGCVFVRLDSDALRQSKLPGTKPASASIARLASLQPRAEQIVDISDPADEVFTPMHRDVRYYRRFFEKNGGTIQMFDIKDTPMEEFYSLMLTTADRDQFGIFDEAYYQAAFQSLVGFSLVLRMHGVPAAAAVFAIHDKEAHYVFSGTSNDFRKFAPSYAMIYEAILEAKRHGCTSFNLGGVQDNVKKLHIQGVSKFKLRFGGQTVEHGNPIDIVIKPAVYTALKIYKSLR